jgi:Ca2+-binding RTX toxin-like protein
MATQFLQKIIESKPEVTVMATTPATSTGYANGASDPLIGGAIDAFRAQGSPVVLAPNMSGPDAINNVVGTEGDNYILNSPGNDTVNGKGGNDTVTLREGEDTYVYDRPQGLTTFLDYDTAEDTIAVSAEGFGGGLQPGQLSPDAFATGDDLTQNTRFVYDQGSGALSFDADGSGSGQAIQIGQFWPINDLTSSDIVVI